MSRLIHIMNTIQSFLFPERCFGCNKPETLFCGDCMREYASAERTRLTSGTTVLSVFRYSALPVRKVIRAVKYRRASRLAERLGNMLCQYASDMAPLIPAGPIVTIPVPLSSKTKRIRGYNHTEVFAQKLSEHFSWTLGAQALKKIKHTPSQTTFRLRRDRKKNIRGSFALVPGFDASGKTIVIVDDVLTSGATLEEISRILKQAGAQKIFGITVAKG